MPAPLVEYYEGTSQVFAGPPGAAPVATNRVLVRRRLDRARSTIEEDVVSEQGPGRPLKEYVVTMAVTGSVFSMSERSGAFRGDGTLEGPAWAWTGWASHATLPDGGTVDSRDRLVGRNLEVEKEYRGARGSVRIVEHFERVEREAYERRRAALGSAPSSP
ncbi:MAG: hypothetical protein MUF64_08120 [Polyangiaceae bacterium]|nr:hypothetical protein [Polyangiaceae bacterium]